MRKQTSTNTMNKQHLEADCGMAYTISLLGGRWKLSILGYLSDEKILRYGELKIKLKGISERMLIAQLKELEAHGLITRISYPEIPPRVEYELSEKGRSLEGILTQMADWGEKNRRK